MLSFWAVCKKEFLSLWVTPLAWVLLVVFLLLQGTIFYSLVVHFSSMAELSVDRGPLQAYFGQNSIFLIVTLLLLCPALTMRLFAEERRTGTIESLLTAPVSGLGVVMGKYLATLATYVLMWLPTLLYVVILRTTDVVQWAVVGSSYLGLFLIGAAYLAIGTLASALTSSQLVALLLATGVEFGIFVLGVGEYIFEPGLVQRVCAHVSLMGQMEDFSKGVIDTRRVAFDLSVTLLSLLLCVKVVDSWRWD